MQMGKLTKRQHQVLKFLADNLATYGYPPTVREICTGVGLKSPSTVHSHLASLEQKGYIRRDPSKGRAIELLHSPNQSNDKASAANIVPVPLVGQVTAGTPILAVENIEDTVMLPRELTRADAGEVFLLRVKGSSMIDAGILDGDQVLVRRQQTADNGDIVVALMDEDATVKRFFLEGDAVRLQPENPAMEPIVTRKVEILGKVIGLIRSI